MPEFNPTETIRKYSGLLANRVEFMPDAKPSILGGISLGILFVMAFWSGPSVLAFRKLIEVVSHHDPEGGLRLVVVDSDRIPVFYESSIDHRLSGSGETFWVKDGVVVSHSGSGYNPDCFEPNTAELLKLVNQLD